MVVSDLGGDTVQAELTVEAENWMSALRKARDQMGETGGVPTGSSCAVAPDGRVTVLDPVDRRRFVLSAATEESFKPPAKSAPPVPADPKPAPPQPATPPKKKSPKMTMAYIPDAPKPAAPAPKKKSPKMTMAYIPPSALPDPKEVVVGGPAATPKPASVPPPKPAPAAVEAKSDWKAAPKPPSVPPSPVAVGPAPEPAPPSAPSAPSGPAAADAAEGVFDGTAWTLHTSRDAEPAPNNPLSYRERTFVVAESTTGDAAQALVLDRLKSLQKAMEGRPPGLFISLAVFDHAWSGQPQRPPIVTAQFKDWQPGVVIDRPLERMKPRDPSRPPPKRRRVSTDEQDARLADAFEACQDLLFVATPFEAVEFVVKLLDQLIPTEAATGLLYDIDDDLYRTIVATGPGSEGMKGQSHPSTKGLFGAASRLVGAALRIDDVGSDARFDKSEREGVAVRNALYLPLNHNNRLLGMIQLINRSNRDAFTASDADLAVYIGSQLSQFLFKAKNRAAR